MFTTAAPDKHRHGIRRITGRPGFLLSTSRETTMELKAFATKIKALGCLIRSLTLAIAISPTSLAGTALAADLNRHGLTGSWYNPAASGQGIELEVYQDAIAPGIGYLQGSWATFAIGWENGQRWYTFGGTVRTGQASSTFV